MEQFLHRPITLLMMPRNTLGNVIAWILNAVSKAIQPSVMYSESAKEIWAYLATRFSQTNGPRIFQLRREILNLAQGLLTAVHKDYFRIVNHQELLFNDFGDRVAQLLHFELVAPVTKYLNNNVCREILIVNTHLLFPHSSSLCLERLHQVYKILEYVEWYQQENKLNPLPILLSKGVMYTSFLDLRHLCHHTIVAHQYTDADAHKWIKPPQPSREHLCEYQIRRDLLTEDEAFAFLKADSDGDYITYKGFCEALRHLNLVRHCNGLSAEEIQELWEQTDIDVNGVLAFKEFKERIWNATLSEQGLEARDDVINDTEQTIGFSVKNAVLFPTEVEKEMWPENYSLSDHARLTVVFSPVRMTCSRLTP
ncbi:hypothetical protein CASFOL_003386 [Castilleja foliolosa]|uniref:EF-hand domain-containing protein n=1 Tax=Castilleja foliolosa TaxID=1961234 RepID=A0ABD3EHC9_9LAMI